MTKLTLLVDTNWLLRSRLFYFSNQFRKETPELQLEAGKSELIDMMHASVNRMRKQFPDIDDIYFVSDGGSWRKGIHYPKGADKYKGNRVHESNTNWTAVFEAEQEFLEDNKKDYRCFQCPGAEGDDWIWYLTEKLQEAGRNCMIWSSDRDLTQLINVGNTFIVQYSNKSGLTLPSSCIPPEDILEYMMGGYLNNPVLENLKKSSKKVTYIDPDMVPLVKIMSGDSGDNIKSCLIYESGKRKCGLGSKTSMKILDDLDIHTMERFINTYDRIVTYIYKLKGSKHNIYKSEIREMLIYNTQMVWLDKSVIPVKIQDNMRQLYDESVH